ncbi:hypothetical protein [Pseudoclavibacter helvolus]|uniref:hypothetical protein n=1 Tax=Pseudoclavibacter helvolus TaxID=255205 RepID=UPI000A627F8B|nr:hypothetical protein [Pseudoclavibacter helvolus]
MSIDPPLSPTTHAPHQQRTHERTALPNGATFSSLLAALPLTQVEGAVAGTFRTAGGEALVCEVHIDAHLRSARSIGRYLNTVGQASAPHITKLPQTRHLVLLVDAHTTAPALTVERACDRHAERIHVNIERTYGIFISVTSVLVTGCTQPRLLAARVCEHIRNASPPAAVAIPWEATMASPISRYAANQDC